VRVTCPPFSNKERRKKPGEKGEEIWGEKYHAVLSLREGEKKKKKVKRRGFDGATSLHAFTKIKEKEEGVKGKEVVSSTTSSS